ncbi:MAG: prolipoprotein diacylglyceryl transferase family protein [Silvibacterium sp.]
MHPRLFQFGHIAIPTYGVLTALAIVAALFAAMHFTRRLELDHNKLWNLGLIATLTTLIGARLLLVAAHFGAFRQHPFWILGLTGFQDRWIAPASILLGFAAATLYALAEGLPLLRTMDCLAPAVALAVAINRMGAFLAGIDYGAPADLPWSVTYTNRIAALWYRTPLGISLHPVQLYGAAVSLAIFGLLSWWLSRRRQDGEVAGAGLFFYGLASFFLGFYCGEASQFGLSQPIAVVAVIAGAATWLERRDAAGGYTSTDDFHPD